MARVEQRVAVAAGDLLGQIGILQRDRPAALGADQCRDIDLLALGGLQVFGAQLEFIEAHLSADENRRDIAASVVERRIEAFLPREIRIADRLTVLEAIGQLPLCRDLAGFAHFGDDETPIAR